MSGDLGRQAMTAQLAATARHEHEEDERARRHREARRTIILERYGSARAALAPCARETALRDATWRHVVPGSPESGPSLMGWREGSASALPREVLADVSAAIRAPATAAAAWEEHRHWAHRAEVRAVLGAPPPPPWVLARCAFLEARLDTLFMLLPGDEAALAEWQRCEAEFEREQAAREGWCQPDDDDSAMGTASTVPAETGHEERPVPTDGSSDPGDQAAPAQTEQPARTREEARQAVRALLAVGLTDREIARRIGVSPSTVGAVRKAVAGELQHERSR